jgi:hypothetical protein
MTFHAIIVVYVIRQQMCIPEDNLMIAHTGPDMLWIEQ